jgi:hypothetical protein
MQQSSNNIFDSNTATNNAGNWINIGNLAPNSSLHIVGLEAGGSLQLLLSNVPYPGPQPGDTTVVALTPIAAIAGGGPLMVAGPTLPVQYLQVVKTPGVAPTRTTVQMFGQIY